MIVETTKAIQSKDNGLYLMSVNTDLKGQVLSISMTNSIYDAMKFSNDIDEAESLIGDENGGVLSVAFDTEDNGSNHFEVVVIDWNIDVNVESGFAGTRPVRKPHNS